MPWRVARNIAVVLAAVTLWSWPAAAEAHVLSPTRARAVFLDFAHGVAYSHDISNPPQVRCFRHSGNPHSVYCDWSFAPEDAATKSPILLCRGRYRVYVVDGRNKVHRAVVRRIACRRLLYLD